MSALLNARGCACLSFSIVYCDYCVTRSERMCIMYVCYKDVCTYAHVVFICFVASNISGYHSIEIKACVELKLQIHTREYTYHLDRESKTEVII